MAVASIFPSAAHPCGLWWPLGWDNVFKSPQVSGCSYMGAQRRLLQASYSINSENIHSRNWKICSACLRQDAVSIKGCEAQLQLESQINPKGWKSGHHKHLEQSIPWNMQIDVYLMLSRIHCWIFKIVMASVTTKELIKMF